jgi:hypothetical protein
LLPTHLIRHSEANEEQLKEINNAFSSINMDNKLVIDLVQLPVIVAGYLNVEILEQAISPSKIAATIQDIRLLLKEQYGNKIKPNEERLKEINNAFSSINMDNKLLIDLVQLPAIVARYLNVEILEQAM